MPLIGDDILQVRTPGICFYVLRAVDRLYLIDAGFIGGQFFLRRALRACGWQDEPIRGIIVTHGHLDHILNVAKIARASSAWIAAPKLDLPHYQGKYQYAGAARVCGWLEGVGRQVLRYKCFKTDRWLDDGDELGVWKGLTAIHLPGHTVGHTGLYCRRQRLLFSGDLFRSYGSRARLPLDIWNSNPAQMDPSLEKAMSLNLAGILPNHCDAAPPHEHFRRLRQLHVTSLNA